MSGSAIPASQIVSVVPSVLNAGGTGLDLNGLLITTDNHIPIGKTYSFPNLTAVQAFFGPTSYLSMLAGTYFLADINATKRPGALLMTCWPNSQWAPGWLMSAQLPTLTLAQLQAIQPNSTFQLTIDGTIYPTTPQPITLSTVSSFSQAAQIIGASLNFTKGIPGAAFTGSISPNAGGSLMNVTANTSGAILQGDLIVGPGVTHGTYVKAVLGSTDGGKSGQFQLSNALTLPSQAMTSVRNPCTWDANTYQFKIAGSTANNVGVVPSMSYPISSSGNLVTVLCLTQATGAVLQPLGMGGAATPFTTAGAFMDGVVRETMNWASFMTAFDPDQPGSNAQKQAFAAWVNAQQNNYLYVCWDTDPSPSVSNNAPASLGRILNTSLSSGTAPIYSPTLTSGRNLAAFAMGTVAAIDFNRLNGRKTLAFRGQTGITPDITSGGMAANLEANFYNYYGIWTTANDLFRFLYPGTVSGPYRWIDSFVNQIWMNNGFQLALMELLTQVGSIPYNQEGYTLIKAACQDVINRAVNFGAIRAGVTLSEAQIAEVNNMAGAEIDGVLNTVGYFLQVLDADPQVRANRGTPPCTFWYMDGGSVQRITLASIMVQ